MLSQGTTFTQPPLYWGVALILVNELKSGSFPWDFQRVPERRWTHLTKRLFCRCLIFPYASWNVVVTTGTPAVILDDELT